MNIFFKLLIDFDDRDKLHSINKISQMNQERNRLKRMKNEVIYRNNPGDQINRQYQLIPDDTPTNSPKTMKKATPASTLYYGDLPEIMHPTIEFDKLNPLKNMATSPHSELKL